jgi:hypothetical protein
MGMTPPGKHDVRFLFPFTNPEIPPQGIQSWCGASRLLSNRDLRMKIAWYYENKCSSDSQSIPNAAPHGDHPYSNHTEHQPLTHGGLSFAYPALATALYLSFF